MVQCVRQDYSIQRIPKQKIIIYTYAHNAELTNSKAGVKPFGVHMRDAVRLVLGI